MTGEDTIVGPDTPRPDQEAANAASPTTAAPGPVAPPSTVALLGLGAMGRRLAGRLAAAGFELRVWNRTPTVAHELAAGDERIVAAASPGQAVSGAVAVLVCVRDDDASAALWDEIEPALAPRAVAVDLSTLTPEHVRALARRLGERFLEAPMVGSRPQVDAGQLRLLVGGSEQTLRLAQPVLAALGVGVHHLGTPGQAAVAKLAVNGLLAVQLAAAGELLGTAQANGLSPDALAELLAALPVTAPALARSLPRALAGDTSPNFPLDLVGKDLGYLDGLPGGPRPVVGGTRASVDATVAAGLGSQDIVALARPVE